VTQIWPAPQTAASVVDVLEVVDVVVGGLVEELELDDARVDVLEDEDGDAVLVVVVGASDVVGARVVVGPLVSVWSNSAKVGDQPCAVVRT